MLEDWQIKILDHWLAEGYDFWADKAMLQEIDEEKLRKELPEEKKDNVYTNRELVLQWKSYKRLEASIKEYNLTNEKMNENLSENEKVDLIIASYGADYKNAKQREIEYQEKFLAKNKIQIIERNNDLLVYNELIATDEEINNCATLQELNIIHIRVETCRFKMEVIDLLNKYNLQSAEAPTEADIRNCQTCEEIQIKKDLIIYLKKQELSQQ
jgi:hypothetical protein